MYKRVFLPLVAILLLAGCADLNAPYGGYNDPYNDPYYRPPRYDGYYGGNRDRYHDERREIRSERERLEDERERLEDERRRQEAIHNRPPPPRPQESCPSGFSPSEQKCSSEERRRGCKDIRLPGGLGCVRR